MKVYIVLDINLAVMQEMSVESVYLSKEEAFNNALDHVLYEKGIDIKIHNHSIEGYESTDSRLSNNNCLGSNYGISYKSNYGNYPCCKMIVEKILKGA